MDNTYFIFSEQNIEIAKFHLCTWEFQNATGLIEIGCEISSENFPETNDALNIDIYIPWLKSQNSTKDLYTRLKDTINAKFIFNDSVSQTNPLDDGRGLLGVIHEFQDREPLCILPISLTHNYQTKKISVKIDLTAYNKYTSHTNIYVRFSVSVDVNLISIRKKGIGHSTIIYDLKINEGRNLPDDLFNELQNKPLCSIKSCFCFNIVPNSYSLSFFDSSSLQNVRTLEFDAFNRYLEDKRVQKDQLMVVFNKKKYPESFSFFSIFLRERIGAGQFALAILINLISGILLFLPGYRRERAISLSSKEFWTNLPLEVYIAVIIGLSLIIYFIWPVLVSAKQSMTSTLSIKKNRNKK